MLIIPSCRFYVLTLSEKLYTSLFWFDYSAQTPVTNNCNPKKQLNDFVVNVTFK